jgi:putative DNA primase/helicase
VLNGTVDLRTGDLRAPDRSDLITKTAGCEFDQDATCPRWMSFLSEITAGDESLMAYLRALVGYTLTGETSGQMLMFLYGTGQNGKSVFIEVIRDLLGEYGVSLRTDALSLRAFSSKNGPSEDIARLMGARMVTVNETAEGMRFDEALVKDLTGEDTVAARRMYQGTLEFRPAFKIWIRGNHQPEFNGADGGMARRVRLIPFEVRIPDEHVDPQLRSKLRSELPGILNWAIEGCMEWQRRGRIDTPQKVLDATSEYVEAMDGLADFLEAELVRDERSQASIADIFRRYEAWCVEAGIRMPMTKHKLGLRLKGRGFKPIKFRVKGKEVRGFLGLRIKGARWCITVDDDDQI